MPTVVTSIRTMRHSSRFDLDMSLAEPAYAHDVRDSECVGSVGLVALRGYGGTHMPCLQAYRRKPDLQQPTMQPGREHPRFMANAA